MSVHELVMLKFLAFAGRRSPQRDSPVRSSHTRAGHLRNGGVKSVGAASDRTMGLTGLKHAAGRPVASREVYLEGYETHEQVVRAYLEFSGIDPDSKEGRFYFEL